MSAVPPRVRTDRIIVRAAGNQATGDRIAARLPAMIRDAVASGQPTDAAAVRALVARAAKEAAR